MSIPNTKFDLKEASQGGLVIQVLLYICMVNVTVIFISLGQTLTY